MAKVLECAKSGPVQWLPACNARRDGPPRHLTGVLLPGRFPSYRNGAAGVRVGPYIADRSDRAGINSAPQGRNGAGLL